MADQFALITSTVPTSSGTQSFSDSMISDWDFAIVLVSGDTATPSDGARISLGWVDNSGSEVCIGGVGQSNFTTSQLRHSLREDNVAYILDDAAPNPGVWASATHTSSESDGFTVTWTIDAAGVSGRTFNIAVLMFGGLSGEAVGGNSADETTIGFTPDLVLGISSSGPVNQVNTHLQINMGAAVAGITQAAGSSVFLTGTSPTEAVSSTRNDRYANNLQSLSADEGQSVTAFTGTGYTETPSGTPVRAFGAIEFSDVRSTGVAIETLSGGTGSTSFTGLGFTPMIFVGIINGNTANNTVETGAPNSTTCIFMSDGATTYSATASFDHGVTFGNVRTGYSGFDSSGITMLSESGGTDFAATVDSVDASGFTLNITTGFTGRMVVWGIERGDLFESVDESVNLTESAAHLLERFHAIDESVDIAEDVQDLLIPHEFPSVGSPQDVAQAGARIADTAQGGVSAADDANAVP